MAHFKTICAWCNQEPEGSSSTSFSREDNNRIITHSICEKCVIQLERYEIDLQGFLDSIEAPLIVVDKDHRVLATNQDVEEVLNKDQKELVDSLVGDVIECVYSRLEEGCGATEHCSGCTIRRTIDNTYRTGQSHEAIKVSKIVTGSLGNELVDMIISTEKVDGRILVRLDQFDPSKQTEKCETELETKSLENQTENKE